MAARQIQITDTLETFRQQFNALSATDFGDIGTLSGTLSATSIVGAMNELAGIVASSEGFSVEDSSSSQQLIGAGEILRFFGTSNQTNVVVSAPDTVTVSLVNSPTVSGTITAQTGLVANTMSIATGSITDSTGTISFGDENLQTTGTLTVNNSGTNQLGTIVLSGSTITTSDSSNININQNTNINADLEVNDSQKILLGSKLSISKDASSGVPIIKSNDSSELLIINAKPLLLDNEIKFEGSSIDTNDTTLTAVNPTSDRVITLPDATGTVALTNTTGYATSSIFTSAVTLIVYNSAGAAVKTIVGSAT